MASIAADPTWSDRGDERHLPYWEVTAFGDLTASAQTRRAALERLLPMTKIGERCHVEGRYLVVRGRLRTYKIHIGSGNITARRGSTAAASPRRVWTTGYVNCHDVAVDEDHDVLFVTRVGCLAHTM